MPIVIIALKDVHPYISFRGLEIVDNFATGHQENSSDYLVKTRVGIVVFVDHNMRVIVYWNLQGSQDHDFNIYIHARPGYAYTEENTKCRAFVGRQLKNTIQVRIIIFFANGHSLVYRKVIRIRVFILSWAIITTCFPNFIFVCGDLDFCATYRLLGY